MLSLYSKVINCPVIELKTQTQIGVVDDLVLHKTKLEVHAVTLKKSSLFDFNEAQVVINTDIVEINSKAVIVNNPDSIVPLSEAIRIKEAIDDKYYGIYQKVVSTKGKTIGMVYDYLVDSSSQKIVKIYCRTLFNEKIIPSSSVIKMEGKKIFIKDDYELERITSPAVGPSVV